MGNKTSKSYPNPERKVYEAARDGTADLSNILRQMSVGKRRTALETKTKDRDQIATPLIIAARNGNMDSVKELLRYKADIEARGTVKFDDEIIEGCTPLWAAVGVGHHDVVKLLIERNADVDGRTVVNSTPLRAAAYDGRLDILSCLVENGADVNASTDSKSTPLMMACCNGHMDVVAYLIERGANVDLQNSKGDTALHYAAQEGKVEIAKKLLSFGALHMQNNNRLTPLLSASNECQVEMVEYFVQLPECTKEQIDALELLGATIANNSNVDGHYDIKKAFYYMERGMKERFKDASRTLLKNKMESVEVYQNRKESQTLKELVLLQGDDHGLHMEGLIMRERILGTNNTELCDPIRDRGGYFANSENFDLSIGLWRRAMEIRQRCNQSITDYVEFFAGVFGEMVQKNWLLRLTCIEGVFKQLALEYKRLTGKLNSGKFEKAHKANLLKVELERMVYCALYLLMVYTKAQVPGNKESTGINDLIHEFLCLNPRTHDGNTLLHLAVWYKTPIKEDNVRIVCKLPCVETMKLILHARCDVNAVNNKGESALHLAVTFKPNPENSEVLKDMLKVLLHKGADVALVNRNGKTAEANAATDEARSILFKERAQYETCVRSPESPSSNSQELAHELVPQCTDMCSFSDGIIVAILVHKWCFPFSAFSYLSRELAIQFSKHPQIKVSLVVPQKSLSEEDKKDAHSYGIAIVEAQARPGFPDPTDWLYFTLKYFVADVLVALDDNLGKIARVLKEYRQCKMIQVVYSLKEPGAIAPAKSRHQTNVDLCEEADLVVAIGSKIAEELAAGLRYCNKDIITLTPGIISDLSNVIHATNDGKKFRILVLSGDSEDFYQDRLDIAAKAVAELKDKTFHLIFVGVAEEKHKELVQMCCQCGVKQQLSIRSFPRSEEDLRRLFCEVDLAILVSTAEGSGLIALGALSAGLPVVVTDDSGFAEALRELKFGDSVVKYSEDVEEWATAIKKVQKTDRKLRLEQAASLRSYYNKKNSWEKQCRDLVEKMLNICKAEF